MRLIEGKINKNYTIEKIDISDEKLKLRLEDLGMCQNGKIKLMKYSPLKKTVLIEVFEAVFAIKYEIAKNIFVVEDL